jgi:hypothetical protein
MTALRGGVVAILLLATAVAVVAAPAFATPRLTSSTSLIGPPDGGAVSPFFTPIGNTTTSSERISQALMAPFVGLSFTARTSTRAVFPMTCRMTTAAGDVPRTHTQLRLSTFALTNCIIDNNANLIAQPLTRPPYFVHVRAAAGLNSWDGSFNIQQGSHIPVSVRQMGREVCFFEIDSQSLRLRDTDVRRDLTIADSTVRHTLIREAVAGTCPNPREGLATMATGTPYVMVPDTPRDDFGSTLLSSQ